jgi:exodeoxyribonuclease-3
VDTFREFNQEPEQYTWWSYRFNVRARNIGWRLDYFFVTEEFKKKVKNSSILADVMGSDHCPVMLELK